MKAFLFQYRSTGKELMVTLKAENLNKAMIYFAAKYHEIQEVYEIAEILVNSDKNPERSVATESDSSTEADKPLPNSPVREDWISVEDKKPKDGEDVLACNNIDNWVVCGYIRRKKWYNTFEESGCEIYPTHWQPLPAPPIETNIINK